MKFNSKIKTKILLPVIGAIALSSTVFYIVSIQLTNFNLKTNSNTRLQSIERVLVSHRAEDVKMLTNSIFILQKNRELQKYWLSKNRKQLYIEAKKLYSNLNRSFDITHFYFHDTNSINFLRVHKPEKHSDFINRYTMEQARANKTISSGLEVGPLGTFTLRVVAPWYINNKLEGYIELGEEIEHQISNLHKIFNVELLVILKKEFTNKSIYQNGLTFLHRKGNWNDYKNHTLIYKTTKWVPNNFDEIINKSDDKDILNIDHKGKKYMVKSFTLHDASSNDVGKIMVLLDIEPLMHTLTIAKIVVLSVSCLIGLIIFISFYYILGNIEKNLILYEDKALSEEKLRILEQKKHIKELQREEERLNLLFDNAKDAIIWVNPKTGIIINCNIAAENLLEYKKEEIIGQLQGFAHPKDKREYFVDKFKAHISKEGYVDEEAEVVTKSGKTKYINISASIINIGNENIIQGIFRDITEIKEAERKIKESEKRFQQVAEYSNSIIWEINAKHQYTYLNSVVERVLGYKVEELIGRDSHIHFPYSEENMKEIEHVEALIKKNGRYSNLEFKMKHKNGKTVWINSSGADIFNSKGEMIGRRGISTDITERKINIERIKESEEKNRSLLAALPDMLFVFDKNGVFLDYHSRSKDKLAAPPEVFLRKNIDEVFPPDIATLTKENITKTLSNNEMNIFRYSIPVEDKILNEEARMVRYSEDKVLVMTRDITDVLEAENKLVEAKERAEKADSLKSTFLAQMSHEIRTPINSIISLSSIVEEVLAEYADEDIATCFSLIKKSGDRIVRTTDLILNLSEVEAGTYEVMKEEFNLIDEILQKLFNEYSVVAKEKDLELKMEISLQNPIITADSYTIEQIFRNLIDNAIKYSDNGKIFIKAFENENGNKTVEVIDSGVGISSEYMHKIFTSFSQEVMGYTRNYEGNGVGLSLTKKYCELNNATIEVESKKGVGSTFRVVFL